MPRLQTVRLTPQPLERFASVLPPAQLEEAGRVAAEMRKRLSGRVFWNINTTAVGGGVAEMLQSLLRYTRGMGIDTRWLVIEGNPEFFRFTKRLHHALHGSDGDGSDLCDAQRALYERTLADNAVELAACVKPRDIVLLHDPQTAGLAPHLLRLGAEVIWRCHIGHDSSNEHVEAGWRFLAPYLEEVRSFVFSRSAYVPPSCDHRRSSIIQPSIDAFSPKNCDLDEASVRTILVHTGLVEGPPPDPPHHEFERVDGSPGRIERRADVVRLGRAPAWDAPLVVQVSRWDPLKDMAGVMRGFAALLEDAPGIPAHLVLAGPNVKAVADDPEGGAVFDEVLEEWREMPHWVRNRVHLASLPTADVEENAMIVNALQRHAAVVVQKSLKEGFGLTVTEAMWKGRPVIASAVGGIQDQIEDGVSGLLIRDPTDLGAFQASLCQVLEDPEQARRLGDGARERVRDRFLGVRHLLEYARLIEQIDAGPSDASPSAASASGGR